MENNSIHPDEMDRLLRETFLESDFPETDSMTDLMAQQAFNTPWAAVPPAGKELGLITKKGFLGGFSLNSIIGSVLLAGLGVGTGIYLLVQEPKENSESKPAMALMATPTLTNEADVPAVSLPKPPPPAPVKTEKPVTRKPIRQAEPEPTVAESLVTAAPVVAEELPKPARSTDALPEKPYARRYILIPDISEAEAIANEKRKMDMLRQVIKQDKKEWAYIPMGTTSIDQKPVSVQAFYMMAHEVSNIQYKTFLYDLVLHERLREYEKAAIYDSGWVSYGMENFVNYYFWHPAYNDYPVVNVSLEGAQMFCEWLTIETNKVLAAKGNPLINDLRLPMTEEWIYAAKADHDSAVYAWKGIYLRNARGLFQANFRNSKEPQDYDGTDITAPVTEYLPNDWGLYNLCGNVGEMTLPEKNGKVSIKGGSWSQPAEYMHLLHENRIPVNKLASPTVGFRPVYTFITEDK